MTWLNRLGYRLFGGPIHIQAALEGFQIGVATSAQLIAEVAVNGDSKVLRDAERQVRALPGEQV